MENKPGIETSEFKMTKFASIAGIVMVVVGSLESMLVQLSPALGDAKWIGVALMVCGTILKLGAVLGYQANRADVKEAAMKAEALKAAVPSSAPPPQ